jgi:hypothetical protein
MDGRPSRHRASLLLLGMLLTVVTISGGCTTGLFTLAYLIKGNSEPAECKLLKEKKVVVVCRSVVELQYRNARVEQDVAQQVGRLLKENVPKIKLVEHRKVAEWMDEHSWDDYYDVGKALGADIVVGIDLEHFDLYQGQTLYQGRATAEIKVYDCKTKELLWKKRPPRSVYPPNRVVQTSEKQESEFRQEFVHVLADQLGRYFYDHDPYTDFGLDSKTIE